MQYGYSALDGNNRSRLTSMTYPNGRVIGYNYANGLDSTISRLSSITDGGVTLESYSYLGLDTVVVRSHPQTGVDLSYVKLGGESVGDAGDQYTGLDTAEALCEQQVRQRCGSVSGSAAPACRFGLPRGFSKLDSRRSSRNLRR